MSLKAIGTLQGILNVDNTAKTVTAAYEMAGKALQGMSQEAVIAAIAHEGLNETQAKNILSAYGLADAELETAVATATSGTAAEGAAVGFTGFGAAVKAAAASVGTFLLTNPVGWLIDFVAFAAALGLAFDAATDSYGELSEKAAESKSAYEDAKSEVESLNGQLETTQQRIDELHAQGTLSITDAAELTQLEAQNDQLRTQIALKQQIADLQQAEAVKNAAAALTVQDRQAEEAVYNGSEVIDTRYYNVDILEETRKKQEELNTTRERYNKLLEQHEITGKDQGADSKQYEQEAKWLDDYTKRITELESDVLARRSEISTLLTSLLMAPDGYDDVITRANDVLDYTASASDYLESVSDAQSQIESVLSRPTLQKYTDQLVELSKAGEDITFDDIQEQFPLLASAIDSACAELELSRDNFVDTINSMADKVDYDELREQAREALHDAFLGDFLDIDPDNIDINWQKSFARKRQSFNDFINGLSDEQSELILKTRLSTDTSGWTEEDWLEFLDAPIGEEIPAEISLDFSADSESFANLNAALKESASSTGLTAEAITNLKERYKNLDADSVAKVFEKTANGVHLNASALRDLESEYGSLKLKEYQSELNDLVEQYEDLTDQISKTTDASDLASLYSDRDDIQNQISDISTLCAQYEGLTSAFSRWEAAKAGAKERDMYSSVIEGFKSVDDLIERGWVDDEVRTFVDAMSSEDLTNANYDQIMAAWEAINQNIRGASYSIRDFFTFDANGKETTDGIYNFHEALMQIQDDLGETYAWIDESGNYHLDFGEGGDMKVAEAMGMDIESLQAIMRAAIDAGWDVQLDSIYSVVDGLGQIVNTAREANQALIDAGHTDTVFNFESSDIETLDSQIEEASGLLHGLYDQDGMLRVGVDKSEADAAENVLSTLIAQKQQIEDTEIFMRVDVSGTSGEFQSEWEKLIAFRNAFKNYEIEASINVNSKEANAALDEAKDKLAALDGTSIAAHLELDTTGDVQEAADKVKNMDTTALVKFNPDIKEVEDVQNRTFDADGIVTWTNEYAKVTRYSSTPKTAYGTVIWQNNTSAVKTSFSAIGYLTTRGASRAYGTANATGNCGVPKSGVGLGGETGEEIVVRNGKYFTIGADSAELFNYQKGDIVFNPEQSRQIFANGKIVHGDKRGMAYSSGTGPAPRGNRVSILSSTGSYTSSKSSISSSKNSSSSSKDTEDTLDKIDWVEVAIDRLERAIDQLGVTAESTFMTLSTRMGAAYDEMVEVSNEIELQRKGYDRYIQEANSVGLSEDLAAKVRAGTVDINEYDEATRDLISEYQEWFEKALDCAQAIDELHENLAALYEDNFNNIQEDYGNQFELLEHLTNTYETGLDALEAQGRLETARYYKALQDAERENISIMQRELADLVKSFSEAMNSGEIKEGSEAWYGFQQSINEVKESIDEANVSLLEYDKTMRELEWSYFDYAQERIAQLTQEADFLIDLMSSGDLYDDRGQFSDTGTATMGLHAQNYGTYMAQADMYAKEMERINREIAEDPYNDDLIQRREELLELQQQSILAAEDEKQAIADMVENGIEIELDALKDLIDTYEDSLDSARDLYKYQKDVADQTSEIASLQKQLSAYAGDTSEETRATVQRLQVDLMAAQDELSETEYDQYISDQKKLLDDLYTEYESILNQRLDDVDALLLDMIDSANLNAASINETLHEVSDNVGYTMTDNLQNIWSAENDELVGVLTKYGDGFLENMTSLNAVLGTVNASLSDGFVSILDKLRKMLGESDDEAQVGIDTSGATTSTDPNAKGPTTQSAQPSSTPTTATTSSNPSTPTKTIKVGGMINAKGAPIYDYAGDKSGEHQYFSSDPIYKVLSEKNGYLSVRWHKLSSGVTGWFKKSDVKAYASGGYVYNTGPAWVDGTPQKPEAFLDARDTENIGRLRDTLRMLAPRRLTIADSPPGDLLGISPVVNGVRDISALQASVIGRSGENMGTNVGRVENNIDIHVDHVEDYEDFMNQLVADKKFEKFIQAATVGRLTGRSDSLTKYKYKW